VLALLCAALALALHQAGPIAVMKLAVTGAAAAILGSFLVISDTTGYFLPASSLRSGSPWSAPGSLSWVGPPGRRPVWPRLPVP